MRGRARSIFGTVSTRHLLALCAIVLVARVAAADQVTFPLVLDYPVLAAAVTQSLRPAADGSAVLWGTAGGCRSASVRDVHLERGDSRLRITATGRARL